VARLLLYALGGGWGHLVRGLALGRAAARRGHAVSLLVNTPHGDHDALAAELGPCGELLRIPAALPKGAQTRRVLEAVQARSWDAVVVDTFPRGLGGELAAVLPALPCATVWVHRDLTPRYVERFGLRRFARCFELVLVPGEPAPLDDHSRAVETTPWLVRDPHELLEPADARRRLSASEDRPVVLVSGSGPLDEVRAWGRRARLLTDALRDRAQVRFAGPTTVGVRSLRAWPLVELLPGVDVLVGAGGYNTVHEAHAAGTQLVAIPQERVYDRQARRLRPGEQTHEGALVAAVARKLEAPPSAAPAPTNGVHAALKAIERTIDTVPARRAIGGRSWP
jgi:hypothetical protein